MKWLDDDACVSTARKPFVCRLEGAPGDPSHRSSGDIRSVDP
jgi:hypothetical protein